MKVTQIVVAIGVVTIVSFILTTQCELYTSVDESAKWPSVTRKFSKVIDEYIALQEIKVKKLRKIKDSLSYIVNHTAKNFDNYNEHNGSSNFDTTASHEKLSPGNNVNLMMNPVNAFVILNRLKRAVDGAYELLDYSEAHTMEHDDQLAEDMNYLGKVFNMLKYHSTIDEDLVGSGQALLRLQIFYDLKIDHLINGTMTSDSLNFNLNGRPVLSSASRLQSYKMNAWDCFELGRIAYLNKDFGLAIQWLFKSLEMIMSLENDDTSNDETDFDESDQLKTNILDHMAFSAYKLGLVEYSAKLTQSWLDRDPDNERAKENLQYYLDIIEGREKSYADYEDDDDEELVFLDELTDDQETDNSTSVPESLGSYNLYGTEKYSVTDDQVVRDLCRSSGYEKIDSKNKCETRMVITKDGEFYPALKIEILSNDPKMIRIYDVMTKKEAKYFRQAAKPLLERSTVSSSTGARTSNNRIAKTAWLSSDDDPLVSQIEGRLGSILNIDMHKSERFQVVNYGLGGFYGPHFDSTNKKGPISDRQRNDRLATILIYLNHVEAGGSTVFPRLNVSVIPIERSAIVWYNIKTNGDRDERTLHTGCPVLLGSKWIATKWPREQSNSFIRPCKLNDIAN